MAVADRTFPQRAGDTFRRVSSAAIRLAKIGAKWALDVAPIVGGKVTARRKRVVLPPYQRTRSIGATFLIILLVFILIMSCILYGFFFGLMAPRALILFVAPVFALAALIIWALPHSRSPPTLGIEFLYPAFFVVLAIWPNYLAISLPGLPWITMLRLLGLPMIGLFLISLSVSPQLQRRTLESVSSVKMTWIFLRAYIIVQVLTLAFSKTMGASVQLVINDQVYQTSIFIIGALIFRKIGNIEKYLYLLCAISIPEMLLLPIESSEQHLPWLQNIPAFLQVPDASVQRILAPSFRAGTNFFRAKGTFSTQLETAEYLALLTPLVLYFMFNSKSLIVRILSIFMIPAMFLSIRLTDSRLGLVGMVVSLLLYGMLWSVIRWRSHPRDLLAAATVYAYPAIFLGGIGVIFSSHRLHDMVLGGNAEASSNDARNTQLGMAMKGFMAAPWGHGAGQDGDAMGYAKISQITVDNYFIALLLDYGILGVIFWYGMFVFAIIAATRLTISSQYAGTREAAVLAPLAVALSAFLVMKWVHAGDYNHPIAYMMLGMICALVYNVRKRVALQSNYV